MKTEDRILKARQDRHLRDAVISEYMDFICRAASRATGRYVSREDDVCSKAMIAFNEAIMAYSPSRGHFDGFAATVIHNRVTDYLRKENRHANVISLTNLSRQNEHGEEVDFEIEDKKQSLSDTSLEILSLKQELASFDISFFDLPKVSPKSTKTREACLTIILYILHHPDLLDAVYQKKTLPTKKLTEALSIREKVPERHRKYIIAGLLILHGNYDIMSEYFMDRKTRCKLCEES